MCLSDNRIKIVMIISLLYIGGIILFYGNVAASDLNSEVCLKCHEVSFDLSNTEHQIGRISADNKSVIDCISCHSNAAVHADDPSLDNIGNPANMDQIEIQRLCENCHIAHVNESNIGYASHSALEVSCIDCHTVHKPKEVIKKSDLCLKCHQNKITDFNARTHHPFLEGNIECLDCHNGYSKEYLDQSFNNNLSCKNCHTRQSNPHLYEHEAVLAYSVEGDGCASCHSAHGAENNYLLKQPLDQICIQCHFPSGHLTAHGGSYANDNCSLCHSDIHGSNYNRYFLDKSMPNTFGSNCYDIGCHNFVE